nr:PREDICTED: claudin-19-like [Latimeria chalumnae]|eukprot:XP_006012744.2 PREDICTED: claudin-19-like [Latimeria chalumnae]
MISSLILGLFATVLGLLGLKCTKIGSSNKIMKGKIALTGGVLFIIGGLSSMIAVSWYAQQITSEFFNPMYGGTKFEFGDALYLGWAGSALCMLGGSFLCCSCKRDEVPKRSVYQYSAAQSASGGRIYSKGARSEDNTLSSKAYV